MDRNQVIGLALIFVMLMVYFQFFGPDPKKNQDPKNVKDTVQMSQKKPKTPKKQPVGKAKPADYGQFKKASQGTAKEITLENKNIKVSFNTKGGRVHKVLLKNYKTYDKKPLYLMDGTNSKIDLTVETSDNKQVNLADLYFSTNAAAKIEVKNKAQSISFKLELAPNQYIEQIYSLKADGFELGYDLKFVGLENTLRRQSNVAFHWVNEMKRLEFDLEQSRQKAKINYYLSKGDFEELSGLKAEYQQKRIKETLHWATFNQKFFTTGLIAKNKNFNAAVFATEVKDPKSKTVEKHGEIDLLVGSNDIIAGKGQFSFYFGPNQYYILKKVDAESFSDNVYLGYPVVNWFAKYLVVPLFAFLEGFVSNYGVIIILLSLIIKSMLFPLTYRSYKSMAKMKVINKYLQPRMDAFKEKHRKENGGKEPDMQTTSMYQQELYKKIGQSPFAAVQGCLPMLLQMPILFAMFMFFPSAIELRQQPFLWANDLSVYDHVITFSFNLPFLGNHISIFTLLMSISSIGITMTSNQNTATAGGPNAGMMKVMMYMMPIIFFFVLNSYPSGLSFYYLIQNLITLGQQHIIKRYFVDEEKIEAKISKFEAEQKYKDKATKKKSPFQVRLQEAQEKARQAQQERAEKKNAARNAKMNDKKK
ncbi:membrane protein insertase YidC [uncultured Microscilla sp.]|uniref:membrane protein insertase YidC n=1 Tax=uncultured Microscilla sp. TaxID=432653 RepID=UPI00260A48B3|nr:membrane protein insertase YidC [uncultured Microscilla sp.]